MPYGLKITFLAHFILAGLVGLQHLLAPLKWLNVVILGSFAIAFSVFFARVRST